MRKTILVFTLILISILILISPSVSRAFFVSFGAAAGVDQVIEKGQNLGVIPVDPPGSAQGYWAKKTIDDSGNVGAFCSIAVDSNDNPHISYCEYNSYAQPFTHIYLKYAKRVGYSWSVSTVDNSDTAGRYCAIGVDGSNNPHIAYYEDNSYGLRYAYWTGTAWDIRNLDDEGYSGYSVSIAMDDTGYSHISYGSAGKLKYAYQDASGWDTSTVVDENFAGERGSIALDNNGYPHIAYYRTDGNLKYAYWNGANWDTSTVVDTGVYKPTVNGAAVSMAVDAGGYPHISYYDCINGDLRYAYKDVTGWNTQTVDSAETTGLSCSMKLDSGGHPHIAYTVDNGVYTDQALKYAHWTGSAWDIQVLERGTNIYYGSIALDSRDCPHISYYGNCNLKYIQWVAPAK